MDEVVICAANAYEQKFYFNKEFSKIPESIQNELHIICVLFTEEVGGLISIGFDSDGELQITTKADDADYLYDDIAAGLLVSKIRSTRQELFESLNLFYHAVIKGENIDELIGESDDTGC